MTSDFPREEPIVGIVKEGEVRVLLCRPSGGLNDALCQIERCWNYASKFGRDLIIDFSGEPFLGAFFDLLEVRGPYQSRVRFANRGDIFELNQLPVIPTVASGRLSLYQASASSGEHRSALFDSERGARLSFNFKKDYSAPVLLHHSGGGGQLSRRAISKFKVKDSSWAELEQATSFLPARYSCAHIRQSDYQTDYISFFSRLRRRVGETPLLVLTDNLKVVHEARARFSELNLLAFPPHDVPHGHAIHRSNQNVDAKKAKSAASRLLAELFALSRAEAFYYTNIRNPRPRLRQLFSGLSLLMAFIHENPSFFESSGLQSGTTSGKSLVLMGRWERFSLWLFESFGPLRRFWKARQRMNSMRRNQ